MSARNTTRRLLAVLAAISLASLAIFYLVSTDRLPYNWFHEILLDAHADLFRRVSDLSHSQPRCNFQTFRDVSRRSPGGYISGSGVWKRRNGTDAIDRFSPSICRLHYAKWIPPDLLATCLKRENVRYIAIVSDSNGRAYFHALHRLLSATVQSGSLGHCTPFKHIDGLTYDSYESPDVLVKHRCPCGGFCAVEFNKNVKHNHCYILQARCDLRLRSTNETIRVDIEYISSRSILDYRAQYTNNTGCQKSRTSKVEIWSNTTQAFLLGEFFSNPKPDLLHFFSNTHDKMKLPQLAAAVDAFSKIIDEFVGPSTRLVWTSRLAEDSSRKPLVYRNVVFRENIGNQILNLTRLQWLEAANRILYEKMKRKFVRAGRPLLFPDLLEMSKPVLGEFNYDGVHMKPDWYQFVMSFLLQSLCDINCQHQGDCPAGDLRHWEFIKKIGPYNPYYVP